MPTRSTVARSAIASANLAATLSRARPSRQPSTWATGTSRTYESSFAGAADPRVSIREDHRLRAHAGRHADHLCQQPSEAHDHGVRTRRQWMGRLPVRSRPGPVQRSASRIYRPASGRPCRYGFGATHRARTYRGHLVGELAPASPRGSCVPSATDAPQMLALIAAALCMTTRYQAVDGPRDTLS
jgi:hypothetical protein